ncbi:MAG: hypothetical protein KF709_10665 [Gemmatimonadaceae bacterium]|nr:hypothetical protein [Gemmatimonadaceae bacterium]
MPLRRTLPLLVVAVGLLSGCFHYRAVGRLREGQPLPPSSRVTLYTGRVLVLASGWVENDSIKGYQPGQSRRTEVPLASVDYIESKRLDGKNTVITVGILTVTVLLALKARSIAGGLNSASIGMTAPPLVP